MLVLFNKDRASSVHGFFKTGLIIETHVNAQICARLQKSLLRLKRGVWIGHLLMNGQLSERNRGFRILLR
jgi:hypothetical protein